MARSKGIWVVITAHNNIPIATFTVKHELATWLKKEKHYYGVRHWEIYKMPDGPPGAWVCYSVDDILIEYEEPENEQNKY